MGSSIAGNTEIRKYGNKSRLEKRRAISPGHLLFLLTVLSLPSLRALEIIPSWDSSITSDPNAAIIESTINTAIQYYEARFADPITVMIEFQEMSTAGLEGHSSWWYYNISYSQFRAALQTHATTPNDAIALANLPSGTSNPVTSTSNVRVKTANLRALGFTGRNSGLPGGLDGIIGLHTSQMNLSRDSINPGKYDLLSVAEHEINEVLGLGSSLDAGASDPLPEDLFRYTSAGSRTFIASGDDAYFSIDGVNLAARFNQDASGDYADWWTAGPHPAQVQDAFLTAGATPQLNVELLVLDVIGYNVLPLLRPTITTMDLSSTSVLLTASNGVASVSYHLLASTNLALPLDQWTSIATNLPRTNGNFAISAQNPARGASRYFFALQAH